MADQECPQCGCVIGDKAFRKAEVIYCCEPCAESCKCECGCVNESAQPARNAPMKGNRRGSA
jgi:hypothetical protein